MIIKILDFPQQSKNNPKCYWVKTSDGLMSTFDTEIIKALPEFVNKEIDATITISQDGKYKTIKDFVGVSGVSNNPAVQTQTISPDPSPNKDRIIMAQVAMKCATEIYCAHLNSDGESMPLIDLEATAVKCFAIMDMIGKSK